MADLPASQPFPRTPVVAGIVLVVIVIVALVFSGILPVPENLLPAAVPAGITQAPGAGSSPSGPSLTLNASPKKYSPLMSSTVGIGIEPVVTGFDPKDAVFVWNATYGRFIDWNRTTYQISESGSRCRNNGDKLYWSFYDVPGNAPDPVIINVTALNPETGAVIAGSSLTLGWDRFNNKTGLALAVVQE